MLALLLLLQDDLRSEEPAARERAEAALVAAWPKSETRLRELARDRDPEVGGRAGRLLRILLARDELSPWALKEAPGVDAHFAAGEAEALGADFDRLLEASRTTRMSGVELKSHLLPLVPAALRAARGKPEESSRLFIAGQMGFRAGVPRMIELLSDVDETARHDAAAGLLFMPTAQAIPKLVELAMGEGPVAKAALRTLGQWRAAEGIPAARRALKEPREGDIRALAARLLARTRADGAYDAILPLLDNEKGNGFFHGVSALGELGDPRAIPRLREELAKIQEERARARLSAALAEFEAVKGLEVLQAELDDVTENLREAAASAIVARKGGPDALVRKARAIVCGAKLRGEGHAKVCEEHGDLAVIVRASGDVEILPKDHRRVIRVKEATKR